MKPSVLGLVEIRDLLRKLAEELGGEWLLVGGALVAIWLDERRVTEDLDLVGMRATSEERYRLLDCVGRLGLAVETVNSAADYFVHRIPGWREQVEVLLRAGQSTIYRPTPTLFLLLKSARLSERDLDDCRLMLARCARNGLALDVERVRAALGDTRREESPGTGERHRELLHLLDDLCGSRSRT
ncbi:MAG: hypothetical protein HY303_04015 [Candidatus Wallbacteria bacterium]|nr:hypothetical protein [Candidatus Wallbacteria bacterium]